jgi:uncharacterized membrane protein
VILTSVFEGKAFAQWGGPGGWGMGQGWGWEYGMCWLVMPLRFAFWIAVIVGIVFLIRWLVVSSGGGRKAGSEDTGT